MKASKNLVFSFFIVIFVSRNKTSLIFNIVDNEDNYI